jgi:hypothetical protein
LRIAPDHDLGGNYEACQDERRPDNAMSVYVSVDLLYRKLVAHGIRKVMPAHAIWSTCWVIEQGLAEKVLNEVRTALREETASATLPDDLCNQVHAVLVERPEFS